MVTVGNSVGKGGFNNPPDVRTVQEILNKNPAVQPKISTDGRYGKQTHLAILQFQMAAFPQNHSWDGLIEPHGQTLRALNNPQQVRLNPVHPAAVTVQANAQGGHERVKATASSDRTAFTIQQGQVTFDAEGNENPKSQYYSRHLHCPGGASGVTIGRGYDMGGRSSGNVKLDLISAGMSSDLAGRYSAGAGLTGSDAKKFVHDNRDKLDVISPDVQKTLFVNIVYPKYLDAAENYYRNAIKNNIKATSFNNLDAKVKDIAVDLTYQQGSIYNTQMQAIIQNNRESLAALIKTDPRTNQYENGRGRAKYLRS